MCCDNKVNIVFVSAMLSFWSQNNILSVERFIQSDPGGNSLAESVRTGWMERQLPVLVLHCARDSAVPKKVTR